MKFTTLLWTLQILVHLKILSNISVGCSTSPEASSGDVMANHRHNHQHRPHFRHNHRKLFSTRLNKSDFAIVNETILSMRSSAASSMRFVDDWHRRKAAAAKKVVPFKQKRKRDHRPATKTITTTTTTVRPFYTVNGSKDEKMMLSKKSINHHYNAKKNAIAADDSQFQTDADNSNNVSSQNRGSSHQSHIKDISPKSSDIPAETMTQLKMRTLGTSDAVKKSHQKYLTEHRELAQRHMDRVNREGMCKWPSPRVIRVPQQYSPSFTVLHQCSDDVGCCQGTQNCTAKTTESVELYFMIHITDPKRRNVEVMSMLNHTECHCMEQPQSLVKPPAPPPCKCPNEMVGRRHDGSCQCVCSNQSEKCRFILSGDQKLSILESLCIIDKACGQPACEFGTYLRDSHRCPTRAEKINAARSHMIN